MIDFRYHLVSLVAVFLALTVGVVVGGVLLDGTRVHDLRQEVAGLQNQRQALAAGRAQDQARLGADGAMVQALAPRLTDGILRGVNVAVVVAAGVGDADQAEVVHAVQQGGATVTGTLRLTPALAAPDQAGLVDGVSSRVVPAGTDLPAGSAGTRAATVLAAAVTGRAAAAGGAALDGGQSLSLLQAYAEAKLVALPGTGDSAAFAPAGTVLLVLPAAVTDAPTRALLASLATAAAARDVATVAVAPPGDGSLTALRAAAGSAVRLSTVDGAGTPQGRLATLLAIAAAQHGQVGAYGTTNGSLPPGVPAGPVTAAARPSS